MDNMFSTAPSSIGKTPAIREGPQREGAFLDDQKRNDNQIRGPDNKDKGNHSDQRHLGITELNDVLRLNKVHFELDPETDDIIIRIFDKDKKNVIKQIPSETSLALRKQLGELRGLLLDRTV